MIAVIADDLTGAAEIGGIGWRFGLRTEIITRTCLNTSPNIDLVCMDTDSRHCRAPEAASRVAHAASALRKAGATQLFKKVDSVLRGNVIAEIEAIMTALGIKRTLLAPANPSRGRVIVKGRYLVNGVAINETEFARDPSHPRSSADALEMLRPMGTTPVRMLEVGTPMHEQGVSVAQVGSLEDVASFASKTDTHVLPAGGADFFQAWLNALGHRAHSTTSVKPADRPPGPELFVCGSASESSVKFIASMRKASIPVFRLPMELTQGAPLPDHQAKAMSEAILDGFKTNRRIVLIIGLPLVKEVRIAGRLSSELVRVASMVINRGSVRNIFCDGGSTSVALMTKMGWNRLGLHHEMSPGVVTTSTGASGLFFTIKPGSYLWPELG